MRHHKTIISDAGGPNELAQLISARLEGDREVLRKRVWAWFRSGSIPGEYWSLLSDLGVASVWELSVAAASKKLPISRGEAA